MNDLATDFAIVHAPVHDALEAIERRKAAQRIADFARRYMPPLMLPLVERERLMQWAKGKR